MQVVKRFKPNSTETVKTKYGEFEVPYSFICDEPVHVALEPYGELSKYEFAVVLMTGFEHEFTGYWCPEFNRMTVAIVKFSEQEIGGAPESEEWFDFIYCSLRDVSPD
jgi:hypothetical protein|nr:MAG TPA: hypothetical protein [Caudoviricetes sp.]